MTSKMGEPNEAELLSATKPIKVVVNPLIATLAWTTRLHTQMMTAGEFSVLHTGDC